MPKLAIYIAKKDMKTIEKWRKQVNFSKIFMTALDREIRERSRTVTAKQDKLAAAAEHYKARLAKDSGALIDFGYQLGVNDVLECRLATEVITKLLQVEDFEQLSADDVALVKQAIGDHANEIDQFGPTHGYQDQTHPTWRVAVYEGYGKGVAAAWSKVCEQMGIGLN